MQRKVAGLATSQLCWSDRKRPLDKDSCRSPQRAAPWGWDFGQEHFATEYTRFAERSVPTTSLRPLSSSTITHNVCQAIVLIVLRPRPQAAFPHAMIGSDRLMWIASFGVVDPESRVRFPEPHHAWHTVAARRPDHGVDPNRILRSRGSHGDAQRRSNATRCPSGGLPRPGTDPLGPAVFRFHGVSPELGARSAQDTLRLLTQDSENLWSPAAAHSEPRRMLKTVCTVLPSPDYLSGSFCPQDPVIFVRLFFFFQAPCRGGEPSAA